ncbi:hypothetical protein [Planococcus lenghuensis]|uniref:Uncharacterized protein n=1 Tax=Planococcus lenghuensis TaxID=2213202 RepID=A0A1Q2KWL6_9BACL|nr:hypothetical protein B0X71_05360 [Planococcus lenghuensis]
MTDWKRNKISTARGAFEVFSKDSGAPVCVIHHYTKFNETGDQFADVFADKHQVITVNLRKASQSEKAQEPYELSMLEPDFSTCTRNVRPA